MCISLQSSSSIAVPLSPLPPLPAYSSYSYSYADPHLSPFVVPLLTLLLFYPLPVHGGLLFAFTLYFSPSRRFLSSSQVYSHSPTAAQRRQHCRNWSIEERFFEEAANTNASGCCRCYCRRHRPPTLL